MTKLGYLQHETDWELARGSKHDHVITDVQIDIGGKTVWTKIGRPDHSLETTEPKEGA